MEVESELLSENLVVQVETVNLAPVADEGPVNVTVVAGEGSPGHLDVAVESQLHCGRHIRLGKGPAQSPPAQHVPVCDTGASLQGDELVASLLGDADVFECHARSQK